MARRSNQSLGTKIDACYYIHVVVNFVLVIITCIVNDMNLDQYISLVKEELIIEYYISFCFECVSLQSWQQDFS